MQKLFLVFLFMASKVVFPQASYDSSFHFYYYDQKLSMFEIMPSPKKPVIWMGDSITDGCEWSELFGNKSNINRGISSDNTFGILNRLHEVIKRKPKKVFLLIGINDIARGIPDSIILRNFERIMDSFALQVPNTKLYIQSILPTNNSFTNFKNHQNKTEHIKLINIKLQEYCKIRNITYVNLYSHFIDTDEKLAVEYTNDGLHLNGFGYKKWNQVLMEANLLK
jgi:lysophospholipase L1-like esterase